MSDDTASVTFDCKKCGTRLSWDDDATDETVIACKQCGEHFGTYRDIHETAMNAVQSKVETMFGDMLEDTFRGVKGIEIKLK